MGRWEPDARGRLAKAALELYTQRGFDQTTVAEIAERAGLTKRTFFRHFTDKRDVLFAGSGYLQELVVTAVAGAPESATPIAAVIAGLDAAAGLLQERWPDSRIRQTVITANPELRERELIKLANLAAGIAAALRDRGVADRTANLTAEAGIAAFKCGFEDWVTRPEPHDLATVVRESLDELRAATEPGTSDLIREA
jgi:AcrR family transcriptional regulator